MEKMAIEHLEELYKDELDSHDLKKAINNIDIMSFKLNGLQNNKKLSSKNSKFSKEKRNTLIFKNKLKKDSFNINVFKPKEEIDNLFANSNSDATKKEEEQNNENKFKKRSNKALKICKTFKNCGENINNAKFLLFNKGNNNINKHSINPTKKFSRKESLISNKKAIILQSSKRHKRQKDYNKEKGKISPTKFENDIVNNNILKKKKTYYKTNYSNNKLLYFFNNNIISQFKSDNNENNKENNNNNNYIKNKGSTNNIYGQFRKRAKSNYARNYLYCNSNNLRKKLNTIEKSKLDSNTKQKIQNNNQEIIYDTDNEVENNILCLLDKSFKKNRNSLVTNNKKNKHYGTMELINDNYLKNLHSSLDNKKKSPIDIGKISNSNSISIIKKTEMNQYNINNKDEEELDDEFLQGGIGQGKDGFKNMSTQKIISFGFKDNEQNFDDNLITSNNKSIKNKKKKKYIIYNNINYFKNTEREDNGLEDENNKQIVNEEKNDSMNSYSSKLSKRCFGSFFKCCFLPD